jgi:hypothetical protein
MAKFCGPIGYAIPTETRPGFWEDVIEEHTLFGDVLRDGARWSASPDSTNDDLTLNSQFSVVADPFAQNHFSNMKYIRYMGANWKITSVEPKSPRLIISVGGVYNGPTKS